MSRKIEAIVEKDGSLRLLEEVELRAGDRVLVTLHPGDAAADETALLSEASLAADWERPEEDEAWAHLQSYSGAPSSSSDFRSQTSLLQNFDPQSFSQMLDVVITFSSRSRAIPTATCWLPN